MNKMNKGKLENGKMERLPDAELEVMKVIWSMDGATGTGKIVEILMREREWSRSTVQVLLARLEERGFVVCERQGRLKYYSAIVLENEYCAREIKSIMKNLFHNSYKKMIASLVQDEPISQKDKVDIMKIINGDEKKDE